MSCDWCATVFPVERLDLCSELSDGSEVRARVLEAHNRFVLLEAGVVRFVGQIKQHRLGVSLLRREFKGLPLRIGETTYAVSILRLEKVNSGTFIVTISMKLQSWPAVQCSPMQYSCAFYFLLTKQIQKVAFLFPVIYAQRALQKGIDLGQWLIWDYAWL